MLGGAGRLPLQQRLGAIRLLQSLDAGRLGAGERRRLSVDFGLIDGRVDAEENVVFTNKAALLEGTLPDDAGNLCPDLGHTRRCEASR